MERMTNKLNFDGLRRNVASTAGFIPNVLAQMNTPKVSSEMTSLTINPKTLYTIPNYEQISDNNKLCGKKDNGRTLELRTPCFTVIFAVE
jgi:hypothetical protein